MSIDMAAKDLGFSHTRNIFMFWKKQFLDQRRFSAPFTGTCIPSLP
ncbi:MAG: hypothetical protein V4568_15620 [Pseudomonadota bacterium]